jgi:hypothetical protein
MILKPKRNPAVRCSAWLGRFFEHETSVQAGMRWERHRSKFISKSICLRDSDLKSINDNCYANLLRRVKSLKVFIISRMVTTFYNVTVLAALKYPTSCCRVICRAMDCFLNGFSHNPGSPVSPGKTSEILARHCGIGLEMKQECSHDAKRPNDPSSATRRAGRNDCNRDAPAGFAAAPG